MARICVDILAHRYAPWLQLWAEGKTVNEIAAAVGKPTGTVGPKISELRARYGWFPRRSETPGKKPRTGEAKEQRETVLAEKYSRIRQLWDEGHSTSQIAKMVGKPLGTISPMIVRYRRRYGWFNKRTHHET